MQQVHIPNLQSSNDYVDLVDWKTLEYYHLLGEKLVCNACETENLHFATYLSKIVLGQFAPWKLEH